MRLPITPGSYEPGSMERASKQRGALQSEPRVQTERCTQCLACWIFCPDSAVMIARNAVEVNMALCKGCGICATECPEGAIEMVEVPQYG